MGGDRRRPFIAIPEIEETGMYEVIVNGNVIDVDVVIERQWKTYQHDYDTPPEDICTYEYIRVKVDNPCGINYSELEKEIDNTIIRYKV